MKLDINLLLTVLVLVNFVVCVVYVEFMNAGAAAEAYIRYEAFLLTCVWLKLVDRG